MSSALEQIDGDRGFGGIIDAQRNAHALNARLTHQVGNVGFFHGQSLSDFFFANRWKRLSRWRIEHYAGADSVNRGRNARDGVAGNMDEQSTFTCIVRTGADAD